MAKFTAITRVLVVVLVAIAASNEVVNALSPDWIVTVESIFVGTEIFVGLLLLVAILLNLKLLNRLSGLFLGVLIADLLLYPISILPVSLLMNQQPGFYKVVPSDPSLIGLSRYYFISVGIAILIVVKIVEKKSIKN